MRPTLWFEAKRVFSEAVDVPPEARASFVLDRCADSRLRDEVLRLLRGRERHDARALGVASGTEIPVAPRGGPGTSASDDGSAARPPAITPGLVIGRRYELGERIGIGAFGAVHRARDLQTGADVAVKVLAVGGLADQTALRREVTMLRRTRLRGVVEMLDEGVEHGRAYVVMRLATGRPFPGVATPVAWDVLAPRALALVEAVERLHWLGVLHRDLKPDNVLVAPDGAVTIVDLGVAQHAPDPDVSVGCLIGTPAYLAPERLVCAPATTSTDLYAVGVMLFEAIAGRPPREAETLSEAIARRGEPVTPLRDVAPGVPEHVATTVDSLLRVDAAARPRSARLVATLLRGGTESDVLPRLPWIGEDSVVQEILDAVLARRPLDVAGARGSGRTRALEEAERRLATQGFAVRRTRPATEPLRSLVPSALGDSIPSAAPAEEQVRVASGVLRDLLGAGTAVFADDWEDLDPVSRDVLREVRPCGPLVRVLVGREAGAFLPVPRTEADLRALFRGPDRVFHLREDGARELFRRTAGRPGDVVREIEAWTESGLARFEDGEIVLDRTGLDRLAAHLDVPLPRRELAPGAVTDRARRVAGVLAVAGFPLPSAVLADIVGADPGTVASDVAALVREGVARVDPSDGVAAVADVGGAAGWSAGESRRVHEALARTPSAPTELRVHHMIAADLGRAALRTACAAADQCLAAGRRTAAATLLHAAIRALHPAESQQAEDVDAVAGLVVDVALGGGTPDDLRSACWELGRIATRTEALDALERIARAALLTLEGQASRALEQLDSIGVLAHPGHERRRNSVRTFAARVAGDPAERRSVLRDVARWARRVRGGAAHAVFTEGLAWDRYAEERFAVAARLHERSSRRRGMGGARLSAWINAASASLEVKDLEHAERLAREARDLAALHRLALHEARAIILLRAVAYRRGEPSEPDLALVADLWDRIPPSIAAVAFLTEAAFAWRAGRDGIAADVAARAVTTAARGGNRATAVISEALRFSLLGPRPGRAAPEVPPVPLVPVGIRLQCLALCATSAAVRISPEDVAALGRLSDAVLPRAEVLADGEVRARLAAQAGLGPGAPSVPEEG